MGEAAQQGYMKKKAQPGGRKMAEASEKRMEMKSVYLLQPPATGQLSSFPSCQFLPILAARKGCDIDLFNSEIE